MREYEVKTSDLGTKTIKATEGDLVVWIPTDPLNSGYQEYLRYTAWVEAGNTPEDFWSQSEDFLDTSVSEVTQPKEETTEGES